MIPYDDINPEPLEYAVIWAALVIPNQVTFFHSIWSYKTYRDLFLSIFMFSLLLVTFSVSHFCLISVYKSTLFILSCTLFLLIYWCAFLIYFLYLFRLSMFWTFLFRIFYFDIYFLHIERLFFFDFLILVPTPINSSAIKFDFLREKIDKNGCCGAAELIKLNSYRWG